MGTFSEELLSARSLDGWLYTKYIATSFIPKIYFRTISFRLDSFFEENVQPFQLRVNDFTFDNAHITLAKKIIVVSIK